MQTFLILWAVVSVVSCGILRVSVHPRDSLKTQLKRLGQWEEYVESRSGTYPQHMNDYWDYVYVGNVSIGNPPQNFTVDFDTGSADFFVPNLRAATTRAATRTNANGILLADDGALLVKGYNFGLVTCLDANFKRDQTSDGMFGLSPGATHTGGNGKTLVETAYEQGRFDEPIFTAWLERKGGDAQNVPGGIYTFGGIDRENCGPVPGYNQVTPAANGKYMWWKFDLDGVAIGSHEKSGKWEAVSDSGTTYIITKRQHIKPLVKHAGAIWNKTTKASGKFPIDWDANFDPVVLKIGGRRYPIDHKQLIIECRPGICYFGIEATAIGEPPLPVDFMLGDPWVRQYCQIHDFAQKRIGFAKAKP